jgi:hypothetical protein
MDYQTFDGEIEKLVAGAKKILVHSEAVQRERLLQLEKAFNAMRRSVQDHALVSKRPFSPADAVFFGFVKQSETQANEGNVADALIALDNALEWIRNACAIEPAKSTGALQDWLSKPRRTGVHPSKAVHPPGVR